MTITDGGALPEGSTIRGLRTKAEYTVERLLGEGSKGQVYLVGGSDSRRYALKLARDSRSLAAEIQCLKKLSPRIQRSRPFFVAADECMIDRRLRPFYVMAFVQGESMFEAARAERGHSFYMTGYYLLRKLDVLHRRGYAFGDLKPSNVLVGADGAVSLIDYGGVTVFGQPIRQCTELYDRASWQCGARIADAGYDLFAFALVHMQLADALPDDPGLPQMRSGAQLVRALQSSRLDVETARVLARMINGEYRSAAAALNDWRELLRRRQTNEWPGASPRFIWTLAAAGCMLAVLIYIVTG